jgi:hypothetical protein
MDDGIGVAGTNRGEDWGLYGSWSSRVEYQANRSQPYRNSPLQHGDSRSLQGAAALADLLCG